MSDAYLNTKSDALTLLPLNTTGEIGAQDLRDIANSLVYTGEEGHWDDLIGDIAEGTGPSELTYEAYRDTPWKLRHFRHDQADELHFTYELPHRWSKTACKLHLHFIPLAAGSGTFAIKGQCIWSQVGAAVPANASWTTFTASKALVAGDQFKQTMISLATVEPPANPNESDILLVYLVRDTAVDTYETAKSGGTGSANIALLKGDLHYRSVKLGTVAEYPGA